MPTVEKTIRINAPKNKVWDTIADFPAVVNFHPLIANSYTINDTVSRGFGAERTCEFDAAGKKFINERITRYAEGESYDVLIYGGTQMPPVNNMLATLSVREVSANETIMTMKISYQPKANPVMWVMAHTMIKRFLNNAIQSVLDGAKTHIETGKTINSPADLLSPLRATA